jgi:MoxR-like ATPase
VGKTWLVRDLATRSARQLVELNFERGPRQARLLASNDPREVLGEISLALNRRVTPQETLLFLDEHLAEGVRGDSGHISLWMSICGR